MKKIITILDLAAFVLFGAFAMALGLLLLLLFWPIGKRKPGSKKSELTFAIFDLISNKYSSMYEDALLNGYIDKHYYIYMDFNHDHDRFEKIGENIFFYSIAAHPDSSLYKSGFVKVNMLMVELKALYRAAAISLRNGISFVKSHDPHFLGLNGLLIAKIMRVPCALHMNSDFDMKYRGTGKVSSSIFVLRGIERLFERFIIDSYDVIMADRLLYSKSRSLSRKSAKKYRSFGVRVDERHYTEPESRNDLKKALGIEGKKIILYVGRLHPVKYPEDALNAFSMIRKQVRDSVMLVVGSGILKSKMEEMVRIEGLDGCVHFLGSKNYEELIDILHTADVVLAPHGGMTLVESALAATPIVAYDFDWHPEFLEEGKMGFIVPFRDAKSMADKAREILLDESLKRRMGRYCRDVALTRYSRQRSVGNEIGIYEEMLKR